MRSVWLGGLLAVVALTRPALGQEADGFAAAVAETMGSLQWGMSHKQVFKLVEDNIRERFRPELLDASEVMAQERVLGRMREEIKRVKRDFVVFDGRVSGWDVSAIGPEFRRNSDEAMLVYNDQQSKNHYFFIRGRLWKWYRQFDEGAFGRAGFDVVGEALKRKFGPATEQAGTRVEDGGLERRLEWTKGRTQVIAIDRGTHVVLLLTDMQVHAQLATLRRDALPRHPKRKSTIDAILMTEDEREAFHNRDIRAAAPR